MGALSPPSEITSLFIVDKLKSVLHLKAPTEFLLETINSKPLFTISPIFESVDSKPSDDGNGTSNNAAEVFA